MPENKKNKFYITTPVYYVNAKPHIGHAYTTVAGDVLARFHRERDKDVFLLAGADEHGLKIEKKAEESGKDPKEFVDKFSQEFTSLWESLNIKYDNFIRTTDPNHEKAVQKVLQKLYGEGVIYKGEYEGLYCVGCEQFKNEGDLVNGRCPDHDTVCERVKEESYLLKMADMQDKLIAKIESDKFLIQPEKYKREILSFLKKEKLKDISISRKNVKWGIPLPFDESHTTYVWFDAFLSYLTGLGWGGDKKNIPWQWPADVQFIGKDILRVHATIWPIMLLHLGIELPKKMFVHGHLLSGGRKMSKTIGNVISIDEMLEKFGTDGTRYLLMGAGTFGEDVDVTMERMTEKYNADLANGLGNLVSRVLKLISLSDIQLSKINTNEKISNFLDKIEPDKALDYIWNIVRENNKFIEEMKPWELAKTNKKKFDEVMGKLLGDLFGIANLLKFFMPETSGKILKAIEIGKTEALFPRIR
ncbi:MAG: methionine--tRNA ligase [Candidatus Moranbacteria bacterium]|nr:methionine--tRNA ligase [Candidatus Moranbacteria bacterium]